MPRKKIEIVEKLFEKQLVILKQSEKSFQGKIYLGKKNNCPIYKYKSIKSQNYNNVKDELTKWYFEIKYLSTVGKVETKYPTKRNIRQLIEKHLANHKFLNDRARRNEISLSKNILDFIHHAKIKDLTKKNLFDLKQYLKDKSFTNNTIRHHFMLLRRMYRDLLEQDTFQKDDVPDFPSLSKNASEISFITFDEYKHLLEVSEKRMNEQKLARSVELARKSLHLYIQFMIGSGLRRQEADKLNFENIQIDYDKSDKSYCLIINVQKSKTGPRSVVTKPSSYYAFLKLKQLYSQYSDLVQQFPNCKLFPRDFIKSSKELFKAAKIETDKDGYKRNLTTLRKTYICWGLINGEEIFDISINCGNSPEIIKTNYADKLQSISIKHRLRKINNNQK